MIKPCRTSLAKPVIHEKELSWQLAAIILMSFFFFLNFHVSQLIIDLYLLSHFCGDKVTQMKATELPSAHCSLVLYLGSPQVEGPIAFVLRKGGPCPWARQMRSVVQKRSTN